MDALKIENLRVDFGRFALQDVTFSVRKGAITGLIGSNGAGKSTLIRTIMRAENAVAGSILYDGKKFAGNEKEILSKTACVFDGINFFQNMKPSKLVKMYAAAYPAFDTEKFRALMDKFKLPLDLRIAKYSFGMKKKLTFVLALCQSADLLILDEPTSGVDPFDRNEMTTLLQEYMLDENHAVLFSTHITEDLDKIADYIVMMEDGKIVLDTDKESLVSGYRLVRTDKLTPELTAAAINVVNDMFGYTLLVRADGPLEGLQTRIPTVEEVFVHIKKQLSSRGNADYLDIFKI